MLPFSLHLGIPWFFGEYICMLCNYIKRLLLVDVSKVEFNV